MYIVFNKDTKRAFILNEKPIKLGYNMELAEYYGEIPKNDYLTVFNERQEIGTKTIEKLDEYGNPVVDENGEIITEEVPRTYLTCDLLASFYPPKTEEQLAKEKEKRYNNLVETLIRKKYSQGKVESIHSNYLKAMFNGNDLTFAKKEEYITEFETFQQYRAECKEEANAQIYNK